MKVHQEPALASQRKYSLQWNLECSEFLIDRWISRHISAAGRHNLMLLLWSFIELTRIIHKLAQIAADGIHCRYGLWATGKRAKVLYHVQTKRKLSNPFSVGILLQKKNRDEKMKD